MPKLPPFQGIVKRTHLPLRADAYNGSLAFAMSGMFNYIFRRGGQDPTSNTDAHREALPSKIDHETSPTEREIPTTTTPVSDCDLDRLPKKHEHSNGNVFDRFPKEYDDCVVEFPSGNGDDKVVLAIPVTDELYERLKQCLDFEPHAQVHEFRYDKVCQHLDALVERIYCRREETSKRFDELSKRTRTLPKMAYFREMHAISRYEDELDGAIDDINAKIEQLNEGLEENSKERNDRRRCLVMPLYNRLMGSGLVEQYRSNFEEVEAAEIDTAFVLKTLDEGHIRDLMRSANDENDSAASCASPAESSARTHPDSDYGAYEALHKIREARYQLRNAEDRLTQFCEKESGELELVWRVQIQKLGKDKTESWEQLQQRRQNMRKQCELEIEIRENYLRMTIAHGRQWGVDIHGRGFLDGGYDTRSEERREYRYENRRRRRNEETPSPPPPPPRDLEEESRCPSHYFARNPPPSARGSDRGKKMMEKWTNRVGHALFEPRGQGQNSPLVSGGGSSKKRKRVVSNDGEEPVEGESSKKRKRVISNDSEEPVEGESSERRKRVVSNDSDEPVEGESSKKRKRVVSNDSEESVEGESSKKRRRSVSNEGEEPVEGGRKKRRSNRS